MTDHEVHMPLTLHNSMILPWDVAGVASASIEWYDRMILWYCVQCGGKYRYKMDNSNMNYGLCDVE